jgi:hypothetical protein
MRPVPIPFEVTANGSKIANEIIVVFRDGLFRCFGNSRNVEVTTLGPGLSFHDG